MIAYLFVIFTGAFLLFQVQLILARYLLAWFGGAANVWNTSMLFFQCILLAGYGYAHLLTQKNNSPKKQISIHIAVLSISLLLLVVQQIFWSVPILPPLSLREGIGGGPTLRMLVTLSISVGLPFFILSSTSTLIQVWFSTVWSTKSPYRLYALSNTGSLLALLSYPFTVEPFWGLRHQAMAWSGSYIVYALLYVICAFTFLKKSKPLKRSPSLHRNRAPGWMDRLLWIILPALGVILLLATTNKITDNIAVITLFWSLPLAVYLISFIIAFAGKMYERKPGIWAVLTAIALILLSLSFIPSSVDLNDLQLMGILIFVLFIACLHCHGELHRRKPEQHEYLSAFYLSIATGGAIGGTFVSIIAPTAFNTILEFPFGLLACAGIVFISKFIPKPATTNIRQIWIRTASIIPTCLIAGLIILDIGTEKDVIMKGRNFFGTFVVNQVPAKGIDDGNPAAMTARSLTHGTTIHGIQVLESEYSNMITTYYGYNSGIGLLMRHHPLSAKPTLSDQHFNIGVIGLGTGTLAAYGKPHHRYWFYEIDKDIINLSTGPAPVFSFLSDSSAGFITNIVGDARISIEKEVQNGMHNQYDILVIDAFSGDYLPTHLLTLEAFDLYKTALKPGGVIALNVSSRSFMLEPLIITQAIESGMDYLRYDSLRDTNNVLVFRGEWILLSENYKLLNLLANRRTPTPDSFGYGFIRPWTDDFSNPLQLLQINDMNPFIALAPLPSN